MLYNPRIAPTVSVLTVLLVIFLLFLGASGLFAPQGAATGYGVTLLGAQDEAFIWAKAGRDLFSGLLVLVLFWRKEYVALGISLGLATVIPLVDAWTVSKFGATTPIEVGQHLAAAFLCTVLSVYYLRSVR